MAPVAEAVKESLIGATIEPQAQPQLSQQTQATFEKHARRDEDGEFYMTEEDFVDAIAPENEDYVSPHPLGVTPTANVVVANPLSHSTKSNESSTRSSIASPTDGRRAG
jgi:hypothetical protein